MKILIADDSAFVRKVLTKTLNTHYENAQIISCVNGQEAYDQFVAQKPDLLITDLLMPVMTGQELIRKLMSDGYKINTIVISADIQSRTKEELDALGIKALLNKPLTSASLNALVDLIRGYEND
jgi:two-component system, chemotaxis family, chemotaxis protein CheY